MTALRPWTAFVGVAGVVAGCAATPAPVGSLVVSLATSPGGLDPRLTTDDVSQKISQLIFDDLLELDDHLRVVPHLAEAFEQLSPTQYRATLRQGVRFHDGRELTADDVVFTFRGYIDPATASPRKGGYRELAAVDAFGRYEVRFTLSRPSASFPINLVTPIVPAGAGASFGDHPIGTGPYRFVRYVPDDRLELERFDGYFGGAPRNAGLVLRVIPDDVMRGLELERGSLDIVVNDLAPDIAHRLRDRPSLQTAESPGVDYQYIGLNLRDRALSDVRVRQALAYAIDRHAIVEHLRRGLAVEAAAMLPAQSWAAPTGLLPWPYDPERAKALLREAGYAAAGDPPGGRVLLALTLKVSNTEFNRLQSEVLQQQLRAVGIALDVRLYEFAALYADVLAGAFQLYTLQWTAGSLADPDILRRVFHSGQVPPAGFNRGHYADATVDAWLDEAAVQSDEGERRRLYSAVQERLAETVPYISLWHKRNVAVAQRALVGLRLSPTADLMFLQHVSRADVPAQR
jgi:peptide/nickel transport system substrate-binding protein